jgi:hypothetical protein
MEDLFKHQNNMNESIPNSYDYNRSSEEFDKSENKLFFYKRIMIMLQGIIQRTEIFKPIPESFNLLDPSTHDGVVEYVYDDEFLLPDGRKKFFDWLSDINKNIKKGSRIIYGNANFNSNDEPQRFSLDWYHDESNPPMPLSGEYIVNEHDKTITEYLKVWTTENEYEKDRKKKIGERLYDDKTGYTRNNNIIKLSGRNSESEEIQVYLNNGKGNRKTEIKTIKVLRISYNPKDTVYGSWGGRLGSHERKSNITMEIYPEKDLFFINYDSCLLDDIEFYLNNRVERKHYLLIMPLLWTLKKRLKEEQIQEISFIDMLSNEISNKYNINIDEIKTEIIKNIEWWKNEIVTVWKRPISDNDIKARNMIKDKTILYFKKKYNINVELTNEKRILSYSDKFNYINYRFVSYGLNKAKFKSIIDTWLNKHNINYIKNRIDKFITILDDHNDIDKSNKIMIIYKNSHIIEKITDNLSCS